jgi:hypothetical protein
MRAVKMLVTGSISVIAVAVLACGGSSQVTTVPSDGGVPDGIAPAGDSAADAPGDLDASDGAACTIDADLETAAPPDASLDEAGASVGTCIGCARANCGSQISTCNKDCTCNNTFNCLFNCLGGIGGTLLLCYTQCGGSLSFTGGGPESGLVLCAARSCAPECAACSLYKGLCPSDAATPLDSSPPADSATDAPNDALADAPADAPVDATGDAPVDATGE